MIKKQSVVILTDSLGYGGLQKMATFVGEVCLDYFDKVYLIALSSYETKQVINDSIVIRKLNYTRTGSHLKNLVEMYKTARELRKIIREISPDVICALGTITLFIALLAKFRTSLKIIGSERNSPVYYSYIWRLLNSVMFRMCDGVVFQTEGARSFHGRSIIEKSAVIPNPYIRKGEPLIFFNGERTKEITAAAARFENKKGIDVLISAYSKVIIEHPEYQLIIYGQGQLYNEYIKQANELGIDKRIKFPGISDDVALAVQKSSMFVLPSRFEGIPNVLMEVMGAGVPVVAADCHPGGARLVVNDGRCGLLVPVDNVDALTDAMKKLIVDKELSAHLSKEGMNYINTFSKENIGLLWGKYIRSILN